MKIIIETIAHESQRYPTCGDWYFDPDQTLHIKVSALSDWRREALIAVHELVEVLLCKQRNITQEAVDQFDKNFEDGREMALKSPDLSEFDKAMVSIAEPGDSYNAPYRDEHCTATGIERILCAALGVAWADYEAEIESLP